MSETEKVVCITGASRGIGAGLALGFAKKNYKIGICSRKEGDIVDLGHKIEALGCEVYYQVADVTKREQLKEFANKVFEKFGRIDIWINNAGVMPITLMENVHEDEWNTIVDVNCKGVLNGVGACVEIMKKQNFGHIVNISSDAGKRHFDCLTVYCASKYFVEGLSIGLRRELKKYNIRVTVIQPGDVSTDIGWGSTDTNAIDQYYGNGNDVDILKTKDIFNAVYFAVTQPSYCGVNEILIEPSQLPI
ncbi:hypothetical protein WA158_005883 [Blastocystis sp. Blastoise]